MHYKEIAPSERLKPYVKNYFIFESDTNVELTDTVFPNGFMEIMFNLGEGVWKSSVNDVFQKTPPVELWGQITKPLAIKSTGKNAMLGIRFFAHSASYFLNEDVWEFNNQITDLRDVLGAPVNVLHERLMNTKSLNQRIELIEHFLSNRLSIAIKKSNKITLVGHILGEMKHHAFSENVDTVASRYNITSRYLQKLFVQHTGVTPKLYGKISRFQNSLRLMNRKDIPLTSVAYDCGYFDQSHFIREFKSFTGFTPSAYLPEAFPVTAAFTQ